MHRLAIVARGKNTSEALYSQLSRLLGNRVQIVNYYLSGNIKPNISADLVLISSQLAFPQVARYIQPGCPVLIARRSINYHYLYKLFNIPPGTEVLLVNDSPETAYETISLLKALGVNHIEYHACAPGIKNFPQLDIAVTPGELELVPEFVKTTIDIKTRNIDVTTLVELLKAFSLLDEKANLLSASYMRDIIDFIKKTNELANRHNHMANQFKTLINTVNEGIIALDETNHVTVFNPVAEELLGIASNEVIGKSIKSRINSKLRTIMTKASDQAETFINVNERQLVISVAPIKNTGVTVGKVFVLRNVTEIQRLEQELRRKAVSEQNYARYYFEDIHGNSPIIQSTKQLANKIACADSPVLILGESGTGKELFAQSIHNSSSRAKGPFVAVNFAALTESLLESELFGYIEGSFTGAKRGGLPGLFEQAHQGTVFLDEIGDAPLSFQVKLLRVLQEKQVRRIGGSQVIPINVRVIAATNKDLKQLITQGAFRQDLYYRLKVLSFKLPRLNERKQDIPLLAKNIYLNYFKRQPLWSAEKYFGHVMPYFLAYGWPGNIRELQNVIEYLVSISPDEIPAANLLPEEFLTEASKTVEIAEQSQCIQAIANTILSANKAGMPIGRRSLAQKLNMTENKVRKLVALMTERGMLTVNRGKSGLLLNTPFTFIRN